MMTKKIARNLIFTFLLLFISLFFSQKTSALATGFANGYSSFPITRKVKFEIDTIYNSTPVNNIFTYTITPYNEEGDDGYNFPSGSANNPTTAQIVFNNTLPAYDGDINRYVATASTTIDFASAGTTYSQPGYYIYLIRETASQNSSFYPIDDASYFVIVEVDYLTINGVQNTNKLRAVVYQKTLLYEGGGDKADAIWEERITYGMAGIAAQSLGNLANTSECFDYTVTVPVGGNVLSGARYWLRTIDGDTFNASECSPEGSNGYYTLTANQTTTFSMRHNDAAWFTIPAGAEYIVTAVDSNGYVAAIDGASSPLGVTKHAAELDDNALLDEYREGNPTENATFIIRTKESAPFVGIFTNIWFYLALVIVVSAGATIVIMHLRKKNDESYHKKRK